MQSLYKNADIVQSPSETFFHTALDLGGISTPAFRNDKSLLSDSLSSYPLLYLTDRNQSVPLDESGLRESDLQKLAGWGIK